MKKINFYTRKACLLCEEALTIVRVFESLYDLHVEVRDIETNETWLEQFHFEIPVIEAKGEFLRGNEMTYENIEAFMKRL